MESGNGKNKRNVRISPTCFDDLRNISKMDRDKVRVSGDSDVELLEPQPKRARQVAQALTTSRSLSGKEHCGAYKGPVADLVDAEAPPHKSTTGAKSKGS